MTWSRVEIEEKSQQVFDKIDDELSMMKALAENAAETKAQFEMAESKAMLEAKVNGPDYLTSDLLRKAYVRIKLGDAQLAADIADALWKSQVKVVNMLDTQAGLLRSLMRSSRDWEDQGGWGNGGRVQT